VFEGKAMKILPYSVLAATLVAGMVPGGAAGGTRDDEAGRYFSREASSVAQEETKPKAGTVTAAGEGDGAAAEDLGQFPVGTTICVELVKAIDAKKAKAGDAIVARVTLPVLLRGKIAIANDTKITGRVTEAAALPGGDGRSRLGIVFDSVVLKGGTKAPVALTVQAVGWHPVAPSDEDLGQSGESELHAPLSHPPSSPAIHLPSGQTAGSREAPGDDIALKAQPTLDAGSHGTIGMPGVSLVESKDAAKGSLVESAKKNVRLESETEMVLRVIAAPDEETSKP